MKLHYWPSPALRETGELLDRTVDYSVMVQEMMDLMKEKGGIGLSATQCGIRKRLFVIDTNPGSRHAFRGAFGNPEIVQGRGEVRSVEGCLSFPGVILPIRRYEEVQVRYWDPLEDQYHERTLTGLSSVLFQHELDHINATVFFDHVGQLRRRMALEKMRKGK